MKGFFFFSGTMKELVGSLLWFSYPCYRPAWCSSCLLLSLPDTARFAVMSQGFKAESKFIKISIGSFYFNAKKKHILSSQKRNNNIFSDSISYSKFVLQDWWYVSKITVHFTQDSVAQAFHRLLFQTEQIVPPNSNGPHSGPFRWNHRKTHDPYIDSSF